MRRDVVFQSKGDPCRGWLYEPDGRRGRLPAVVMAHGFSGVKEMLLARFAEAFVARGLAVLLFDYRFLGASGGTPRSQVLPAEQIEDYRNAITFVSREPAVDPERIGVWGTSYSGGHVLQLGAFEPRAKVAVAQVPALCGWRQVVHSVGRPGLAFLQEMLLADHVTRFDDGATRTLPVVAPDGEPCVLGTADAREWMLRHAGDAPNWRNEVSIESVERLLEYDPAGAIELVSPKPLLLIAAGHDSLIPIALVREAFARAAEPKRLLVLPCGHFEVYDTEPWASRASDAAAAFFADHLGA